MADAPPDLTKPETCWALGDSWAGNERHVCRLCAWDTLDGQADVEQHLDHLHGVGRPEARVSAVLGPDGQPLVVDDGPTHIALIEQARHLGVVRPDDLSLDDLHQALADAEAARADLFEAFSEADPLAKQVAEAAAPDLNTATTDELHAIAEEAGIDHADLDDDDLLDALIDLDTKD